MNIRPIKLEDSHNIHEFLPNAHCLFGLPFARNWNVDDKIKKSLTAFDLDEGDSSANYIFIAEAHDRILGVLEVHTLVGYDSNCLSYSCSKVLHRSDSLSVCHEQRVLTLDQALLGSHCFALCLTAAGEETVACELMTVALAFMSSQTERFSGGVFVSLPPFLGELFWQKTGFPLTGIEYHLLQHDHAELLPQTPLYECFLSGAMDDFSKLPPRQQDLERWLMQQGFVRLSRHCVFDGGPMLMKQLRS